MILKDCTFRNITQNLMFYHSSLFSIVWRSTASTKSWRLSSSRAKTSDFKDDKSSNKFRSLIKIALFLESQNLTFGTTDSNRSYTFQHRPNSESAGLFRVSILLTSGVSFHESDSLFLNNDHVHSLHQFPFHYLNVSVSNWSIINNYVEIRLYNRTAFSLQWEISTSLEKHVW